MNKIFKYLLICIVIIALIIGVKYLFNKLKQGEAPAEVTNQAETETTDSLAFSSTGGSFSLQLAPGMTVFEKPEKINGGVTLGEVWFSFGQYDEAAPAGLVVVYGKPALDGKGGACADNSGQSQYRRETIAGQEVEVCEIGGFKAEYFSHPNQKIEYWIGTVKLEPEQLDIVKELVRNTLFFIE